MCFFAHNLHFDSFLSDIKAFALNTIKNVLSFDLLPKHVNLFLEKNLYFFEK